MAAVERGDSPGDPCVAPPLPFTNAAGTIQNLVLGKFEGAAMITSVAGASRSHHYHKTDWHFMLVLSGLMHYYWRQVGAENAPEALVVPPIKMIFTPPLVEHTTYFPEATTFLTFSRRRRDHESHEADIVRVPPLWQP